MVFCCMCDSVPTEGTYSVPYCRKHWNLLSKVEQDKVLGLRVGVGL